MFALLKHRRRARPHSYEPFSEEFEIDEPAPYMIHRRRSGDDNIPPFGIYRVTPRDSDRTKGNLPTALALALKSSLEYPPAMALTAEYIDRRFQKYEASEEEFCRVLTSTLEYYLSNQRSSPFYLARANKNTGGLLKGVYYWIVAASKARDQVLWVNYGRFLEEESVEHFDTTPKDLNERFAHYRLFEFDLEFS